MLRSTFAALVLASALILGASGCGRAFFVPDRAMRLTPDEIGLAYEDVWVDVPDRDPVHGWHLARRGEGEGVVVFFHGNAQNVSAHIASVHWLPAEGFDVFLFDYAGYGRSPGETPDIEEAHAEAEAALRWVAARPGVGERDVVLFGQSLGGSISLEVARRVRQDLALAAVVSDSAFSSYRGIAREKLATHWLTWTFQWPLSFLVPDDPSPLEAVAELDGERLLLMHGTADVVVPVHHGEALAAAAPAGTTVWIEPGVKHIEGVLSADIRRRFVAFLEARIGEAP